MKAGANPTYKNEFNDSAISQAENEETVRLLVAAGEEIGDVSTEMKRRLLAAEDAPKAELIGLRFFIGLTHAGRGWVDARIQAVQQVAGVGQKGVITGVVTDGWLQGHAVAGEWTVIPPCGYGGGVGIGNCFEVTLDILK